MQHPGQSEPQDEAHHEGLGHEAQVYQELGAHGSAEEDGTRRVSESQPEATRANRVAEALGAVEAISPAEAPGETEARSELPYPTEFFEAGRRPKKEILRKYKDSLAKRAAYKLETAGREIMNFWRSPEDEKPPPPKEMGTYGAIHRPSGDIRISKLQRDLAETIAPLSGESIGALPDAVFTDATALAQAYAAEPKSSNEARNDAAAAISYTQIGALLENPAFICDERSAAFIDTLAQTHGDEINLPTPSYTTTTWHQAMEKDETPEAHIEAAFAADERVVAGFEHLVSHEGLWEANRDLAISIWGEIADYATRAKGPADTFELKLKLAGKVASHADNERDAHALSHIGHKINTSFNYISDPTQRYYSNDQERLATVVAEGPDSERGRGAQKTLEWLRIKEAEMRVEREKRRRGPYS